MAERNEVEDTRRSTLLAQFDAAVSELLYLGVEEKELAQRMDEIRRKIGHEEV